MRSPFQKLNLHEISVLLRGEPEPIAAWTGQWKAQRLALHVVTIVVGAGLYGAAMGWWRDPQQALYVAIKFPLIILLTTIGNGLLNAMLAPLLGLNVPLRQSFQAILVSFAITATILGAFSPLIAFLVWNAPPMSLEAGSGTTYSIIKLVHVAVITFAGTMGNTRLFQLLVRLGGNRLAARRVLLAWLAGNLFLGSQLSWILRPFIGSPSLPVQFFRTTALHGNFYENVFQSLWQVFQFN